MATATTATFDKEILGVSEDVHECGVGKNADPSLLDLSTHSPCDRHIAALHPVEQKTCPALEVLHNCGLKDVFLISYVSDVLCL